MTTHEKHANLRNTELWSPFWWICETGVRSAAAAYASRGAGAAWDGSGARWGENTVSGVEVVMGTLELEF